MRRLIVTGILVLATGFAGLMGQKKDAQAQPKGPGPKSAGEQQALVALANAQSQNNPDAVIKAADDLLTKYADTDYKELATFMEAAAYQQKHDNDKAQIFAERVVEMNPKNFQATLMLGELLAQQTRENDLDREEKLGKADKLLNQTIETVKSTAKPNPQMTDQQWEEAKKSVVAEAHNGIGLGALTRKKYDVAIAEFKTAIENDPQPAYQVRLASAYQSNGNSAEAIAVCDKLLADPQLHPQIKAVAQNIKNIASQAKK